MKKVNQKTVSKDQIHIINDKTGEIWLSNATTALRDFEQISKRNRDFSLIFPADKIVASR